MHAIDVALVGGTGLYHFPGLEAVERHAVDTPYGPPSDALVIGQLGERRIAFLARHGESHTIPPHRVNYRANIWALHHLGARRVIGINAVGGIRADMGPRALVLPDQIIDYTSGRRHTFFDGADQQVTHIDFTAPYDAALRVRLLEAARRAGEAVIDGGVYGCTQGPRLETAAEIVRLERDGCDVVGMTGMPEAALAREAGLPYAALCVVANHAAGKGASRAGIAMDEIRAVLDATMRRVGRVLAQAAAG